MVKHSKLRTAYIVGEFGLSVQRMFDDRPGWLSTTKSENADVICWLGGPDVEPRLYNQEKLGVTRSVKERDTNDIEAYNKFIDTDKLLVGICRGGQFLNVMSGGSMWQDVNGHSGSHMCTDLLSGDRFRVTSTHHQMMKPTTDGEVLAVAFETSEVRDDKHHLKMSLGRTDKERRPKGDFPIYDPEVVYYQKTNALCFQPHPEYETSPVCRDYFFDLLEQLC